MEMKKVHKARKKLGRGLLSRSFFFAVLLLLQITLVVGIALGLGRFFPYFYLFLMLLSALAIEAFGIAMYQLVERRVAASVKRAHVQVKAAYSAL